MIEPIMRIAAASD